MPSNQAAYLTGAGEPLVVREAPYTSPGPDSVIVETRAFAINPADVMQQSTGLFVKHWPHLLGCDIAGVVHEVGTNVKNVKSGDRVLGFASREIKVKDDGSFEMATESGPGGFQRYSLVMAERVAKLPDSFSFEEGAVLPLGIFSSMNGLFQPDILGLRHPSLEAEDQGQYVLVWGGSSSVGSCGIQLARNSGYHVIATCSSHNKAYCEELGVETAFDYKNESVVDDIVAFLEGKTLAGIFTPISAGETIPKCVEIAQKSEGSKRIATVLPGSGKDYPGDVKVRAVMPGLDKAKVMSIFSDFLPKALEKGSFKGKPDPLVVGKGLESAQKALDTHKAGVSARKVVVVL